jgi:hypothetical protein
MCLCEFIMFSCEVKHAHLIADSRVGATKEILRKYCMIDALGLTASNDGQI